MADRLAALEGGPSWEFILNKQPKCPHCGSDFDISENEAWDLYDDDDSHEVQCSDCELTYSVRTHKTYAFSTDDQDEQL